MILLDANVLIYAHSSSMPHHRAARTWLDGVLNGSAPVGIPWPSLLAFLRILSNPRAVPKPSSIMALWRQVNDWLTVENVWIPTPHERQAQIFASLLPLAATHCWSRMRISPRLPSNITLLCIRPMATLHASLVCAGKTRSRPAERNPVAARQSLSLRRVHLVKT